MEPRRLRQRPRLPMFPVACLLSVSGIAARPFLPAGQGGLILIAGGLSMTALAMLLLMGRQRVVAPKAAATLERRGLEGLAQASAAQAVREKKGSRRGRRSSPVGRGARGPPAPSPRAAAQPAPTQPPANRPAPVQPAPTQRAPTQPAPTQPALQGSGFSFDAPRSTQLARAVRPGQSGGRAGGTDQLVWPAYVRSAAAKGGLHNTVIVSVDRTRCLLEVRHCRSCSRGKQRCDLERRRLQRAARRLSRRANVQEVSCNVGGRNVCTFHVDMGAKR